MHDHKDRLKSPGDIDEEAEANAERNRGPFLNPTTPKIRNVKPETRNLTAEATAECNREGGGFAPPHPPAAHSQPQA